MKNLSNEQKCMLKHVCVRAFTLVEYFETKAFERDRRIKKIASSSDIYIFKSWRISMLFLFGISFSLYEPWFNACVIGTSLSL